MIFDLDVDRWIEDERVMVQTAAIKYPWLGKANIPE